MDKRDKELLKKIKPERHLAAMITLENIKHIKKNCIEAKACYKCKFYIRESKCGAPCYFCVPCEYTPEDWNEYELTERMYK